MTCYVHCLALDGKDKYVLCSNQTVKDKLKALKLAVYDWKVESRAYNELRELTKAEFRSRVELRELESTSDAYALKEIMLKWCEQLGTIEAGWNEPIEPHPQAELKPAQQTPGKSSKYNYQECCRLYHVERKTPAEIAKIIGYRGGSSRLKTTLRDRLECKQWRISRGIEWEEII